MVKLVGALDPIRAWDGTALYAEDDLRPPAPPPRRLSGAAACALRNGGSAWRLLRDPLGLNKLFWAPDGDGGIAVATRPHRLVAAGHPMEEIAAVPRGTVVDLCGDGSPSVAELPRASDAEPASTEPDIAGVGSAIRRRLDDYLAALSGAYAGARAFVCLSGGLVSSGVAVLAREHFADLVAVSFDLSGPGRRASEDRRTAERLAREPARNSVETAPTAASSPPASTAGRCAHNSRGCTASRTTASSTASSGPGPTDRPSRDQGVTEWTYRSSSRASSASCTKTSWSAPPTHASPGPWISSRQAMSTPWASSTAPAHHGQASALPSRESRSAASRLPARSGRRP
jgi:hypothetical protein